MLAVAFTFLYWFLPNTRVRPFAAMLGGVVAGVLVVLAQSLYLGLMVGSARYDALFGSFAALPLLLVWIYLFWAIVLFGAEVAFAYDNLSLYRREVRGRAASPAESEAIGLRIALEVARAFRDSAPAWTADAARRGARRAGAHGARRCWRTSSARGSWRRAAPSRRRAATSSGARRRRFPSPTWWRPCAACARRRRGDPEVSAAVEGVLGELDAGAEKGAAGRSLADLLAALPPAQAEGAPDAHLPRPQRDHPGARRGRRRRCRPRCASCFGNPSSVHAEGAAARAAVERARERVAGLLGCEPREVLFTAGATEANNTALGPLLRAWAGERRHVVSSNAEHPSVEEPLAALEREGWRVTRLPVTPDGLLDPDAAGGRARARTRRW